MDESEVVRRCQDGDQEAFRLIVERYSGVVRECKTATQFIMITHNKRSMQIGDILYGVTMEQSGVSKRMSVRFEDVSEDGHFRISPAPGSNAA